MPSLGEKLKLRRKALGLTLDEAAEKANVSKSYMWELENKPTAQPTVAKLSSIANAYGVTVAFLIEDDAQPAAGEELVDEVFFRNYQDLEAPAKEQLRMILDTFRKRR
jgi:transcriptional regulator with XRE-family HTH domain